MGRDQGLGHLHDEKEVSIHAPTWGATVNKDLYTGNDSFNPRAHVGRDMQEVELDVLCLQVSIHAPTWGATAY